MATQEDARRIALPASEHLRDLLIDAWKLAAPKGLVRAFEEGGGA